MGETWKNLRNSFVAGLLIVVPVAASVLLLLAVFNWLTNFMLPPSLKSQPQFLHRLIALALFIVIVTAIGWATRLVIGRRAVAMSESLLSRVPLLNKLYAFIKEVSHTMLSGRKTMFKRVVLVPHAQAGMYSVGLVTGDAAGEPRAVTDDTLINVFVPASPPTHGFLVLVPRSQVVDLEMSVADGMRMLISAGAVLPPTPHAPVAPTASTATTR